MQLQHTKPVTSTAPASLVAPQVADNPFHLILGQSDFPVCVGPSPIDSSASSWVELSSLGAMSGRSGDEDSMATFPTVHSGTSNPDLNSLLQAEFQTLLDKGAIEIPEDKSSPGFYSKLSLVPKPNNSGGQ